MSTAVPVQQPRPSRGASFKVRNRLGELMKQPGGRSVVEALGGAERRLSNIKGDCVAALDRLIVQMGETSARLTDPPKAELVADIYRDANFVIAVAGLVGFEALDEVAHGLCELIDRNRANPVAGALAIRIHVDALRLLRSLPADAVCERTQVTSGLHQLWARLDVPFNAEPRSGD